MLINNAGVMAHGGYKSENMLDSISQNIEVNVLGVYIPFGIRTIHRTL